MLMCSVHVTSAERRSRLVSRVGLYLFVVTNVQLCIKMKRCAMQAVHADRAGASSLVPRQSSVTGAELSMRTLALRAAQKQMYA